MMRWRRQLKVRLLTLQDLEDHSNHDRFPPKCNGKLLESTLEGEEANFSLGEGVFERGCETHIWRDIAGIGYEPTNG